MAKRHLQIEDEIECHGMDVAIFEESDFPVPYKIGDKPPEKAPVAWAWAFIGKTGRGGEIETVFLGFPTKQDALDDAFDYRRGMLQDID